MDSTPCEHFFDTYNHCDWRRISDFRYNLARMENEDFKPQEVIYLTPEDERAAVWTHGIGFVLSLLAGIYFFQATQSKDLGIRICCLVFCTTLALVYCFSTLSHAIQEHSRRYRMRAWDQGTIYLLIIGTYTPFIWQGSEGTARTSMLCLWWALALGGFYSKVFMTRRVDVVATTTYLALGWLPAMPLISTTPGICFLWMLLGGVCYSIGVIFLKMSKKVKYSHAVWHILVMCGSACHCYAVHLILKLQ